MFSRSLGSFITFARTAAQSSALGGGDEIPLSNRYVQEKSPQALKISWEGVLWDDPKRARRQRLSGNLQVGRRRSFLADQYLKTLTKDKPLLGPGVELNFAWSHN